MIFRIFLTICVALILHAASAKNAEETHVKSAVPCLQNWWRTNKDVLLADSATTQDFTEIMNRMNVDSLSDPWMQLALDHALIEVTKNPQTKKVGRDGLICIKCIRQLVARPKQCKQ